MRLYNNNYIVERISDKVVELSKGQKYMLDQMDDDEFNIFCLNTVRQCGFTTLAISICVDMLKRENEKHNILYVSDKFSYIHDDFRKLIDYDKLECKKPELGVYEYGNSMLKVTSVSSLDFIGFGKYDLVIFDNADFYGNDWTKLQKAVEYYLSFGSGMKIVIASTPIKVRYKNKWSYFLDLCQGRNKHVKPITITPKYSFKKFEDIYNILDPVSFDFEFNNAKFYFAYKKLFSRERKKEKSK